MRLSLILLLTLFTQSMFSQCYMDRHNTSWNAAWVSCQTQENPNTARGTGHWIQYDLGFTYLLGPMHVWNINDPDHLDRGAQSLAIDISTDGEVWAEVGTYTMTQATGSSIYEGEDLMDFDDAQAQYVLITVLDTYGAECAGLSEVRIEVNGLISDVNESVDPNACFDLQVFPNPHKDFFYTKLSSRCPEPIHILLHDALGRVVEERTIMPHEEAELLRMGSDLIESGMYLLTLQQGGVIGRYQVVKGE